MDSVWLSEKKVEQKLEQMGNPTVLAEHYWIGQFYEHAVFHAEYQAPERLCELIRLTAQAEKVRQSCASAIQAQLADVTLALYGYFAHHDILIDYVASDIDAVADLLRNDLFNDRIRLPFIWGRTLHDSFNDRPQLGDLEQLTNSQAWELLNGLPKGVFQQGCFVSGPLGIIRSAEVRWLPVRPALECFYREGTRTRVRTINFEPAKIKVVEAYEWIAQRLAKDLGAPSEWSRPLAWLHNRQRQELRTDYSDICPVIADCILRGERTLLLEAVLKTDEGKGIKEAIRSSDSIKGLKTLPPHELAPKLDGEQQLQLLLSVPTDIIVTCLDQLILSGQIEIPTSEIRSPQKRTPSKNICFKSEVSSIGIRPAHPEPFAALCSSILRAYRETENTTELGWRLGSDPSRGLEITLTDFIRREGPGEAVSKLILASQPVTTVICRDLHLAISEIIPRTDKTIPRILWKFGFEIARHDEVLARMNRRIQQFEESLAQIDFSSGEIARERIRSEGVNLFISVEEFLDRFIAFNVWLLASDHWGGTHFGYRLSDSRRAVPTVLGESIQTADGAVRWKTNGENALGTQLAYLAEFEVWLDGLSEDEKVTRQDVELESHVDHCGRPFPFRHTHLWADSEVIELKRYKEMFKKVAKAVAQADVAGVRNGLDHQRDAARFPSEDQLLVCVTRLKNGVRAAEQSRTYPVTYWLESSLERVFGASEHSFRNNRGEIFTIYRPATVSSLPGITRIHPVVFAPVNFLGAADSLLFFKLLGESEYSSCWINYPRISKVVADTNEGSGNEICDPVNAESRNEACGAIDVGTGSGSMEPT